MADRSEQEDLPEDAAIVRARDEEIDRSRNGSGSVQADTGERFAGTGENRPLFPSEQRAHLDDEWQAIQAQFVDSPRTSVQMADKLVTKTIDTLAASFADTRNDLERSWEQDKEVSTEELRTALQTYRSFFRRLLSI